MPNEPALVEITLEDGSCILVRAVIADRVRGIDADGDPVVPLGTAEAPIRREDGAEYLYPLTPCCQASGKAPNPALGWSVAPATAKSTSSTGVPVRSR
jgi:hypothetical protein